jgi:integrase/recombinase XerD
MTSTTSTILLPFQPDAMTPAQLAAVSYLARYTGDTHALYAYQLRRWFTWCEVNALDPLEGIQRAHLDLYIRHLGESGLRVSSLTTMMHGVRGFFRFAHIDGLITAEPSGLRPPAESPHRRDAHPRPRPARADPVPAGRPDADRAPRRTRVPARHQLPTRVGGRRGPHRGLRRDPARPPRPAPGRQGHQTRHHAFDRSGPAHPGSLPWPADRGTLVLRPTSGKPIDRRDVYRMVLRIAKAAGIPRHVSPHSLRQSSRPGARCRDCSRPVSPGRSPNPSCVFPRNGLSMVSAVGVFMQPEPRGWGSCCPGSGTG